MRPFRLAIAAVFAATVIAIQSLGVPSVGAGTKPRGGTVHADNGMYAVHVEDVHGLSYGTFTATTGPRNPIGSGINLLFGDTEPGTSDLAVRSYSSGTNYSQHAMAAPTVSLDPLGTITPLGTTGFRTTYHVDSPDKMTIVEDVVATGTTYFNSNVTVTATVTNESEGPLSVGIRQLWDVEAAKDDGPTFQAQGPAGPVLGNVFTYTPPFFSSWKMVDNDTNPAPPTIAVLGSAASSTPAPDVLAYACWTPVYAAAFNPATFGTGDISTTHGDCQPETGGDSAVVYFWGGLTPIVLAPHASTSVAAVLSGHQTHALPTTMAAEPAIVQIGPGLTLNFPNLKATMQTATGDGVPGKTIVFSTGGKPICSAVTDNNGFATCGGLSQGLSAVLGLGYKATFAGDADWLPSSANGSLITGIIRL